MRFYTGISPSLTLSPFHDAYHLAMFLTMDHAVAFSLLSSFFLLLLLPNTLRVIFFILPHTPFAGGE